MRRRTPRSAALLGTALLLGALSPLAATSAQAGPRGHGKGHGGHHASAGHSLRSPVTDENFYFVMADRFANGDTAQRHGRPRRRPAGAPASTPPTRASTTAATSPACASKLDYIEGLGTDGDLADPELQEQAPCRARGRTVGRLPRLLDHRLHADRPAPRHQRGAARR